jgi:hypothetical protein
LDYEPLVYPVHFAAFIMEFRERRSLGTEVQRVGEEGEEVLGRLCEAWRGTDRELKMWESYRCG